MTESILKDIENLAKKFSKEQKEMGDQTQKARHMIIGILQGMEDEKEQAELVSKLEEDKGGTADDLTELILSFFMEKNRQLKASRELARDIVNGIELKGKE